MPGLVFWDQRSRIDEMPDLSQVRSQGGGRWGRPPPPPKKSQKRKKGRERKKENKVARMHMKLPPFNHFQSKIKYKFVLYEENTGHMHQIAPLTTSKCKLLSMWEGGNTPPTLSPPPLARSARSGSVASFPRTLFFLPRALKFNPGYATDLIPRKVDKTRNYLVISVALLSFRTVHIRGRIIVVLPLWYNIGTVRKTLSAPLSPKIISYSSCCLWLWWFYRVFFFTAKSEPWLGIQGSKSVELSPTATLTTKHTFVLPWNTWILHFFSVHEFDMHTNVNTFQYITELESMMDMLLYNLQWNIASIWKREIH